VASLAVQPLHTLPASQPGVLPLGQLARGDNAALDHLRAIQPPFQILPDLSVTHRPYRRQRGVQVTSPMQSFDFLDEALFQHQMKTPGDAFMEDGTLTRRDGELRDSIRQTPGASVDSPGIFQRLAAAEVAHAAPADPVYLEGAHQALRVVGMDARRRLRIDLGQLPV